MQTIIQVEGTWYMFPYGTFVLCDRYAGGTTNKDVLNWVRLNRTKFRFGRSAKTVVVMPRSWRDWKWSAEEVTELSDLEQAEIAVQNYTTNRTT